MSSFRWHFPGLINNWILSYRPLFISHTFSCLLSLWGYRLWCLMHVIVGHMTDRNTRLIIGCGASNQIHAFNSSLTHSTSLDNLPLTSSRFFRFFCFSLPDSSSTQLPPPTTLSSSLTHFPWQSSSHFLSLLSLLTSRLFFYSVISTYDTFLHTYSLPDDPSPCLCARTA